MEKHEIRDALISADFERRKILQPRFLDLGLTLGQGQPRILRTLATNDPMTQRELADLCHLDVTTMSRTLDRLEESGLLNRCRRPNSRRSYIIELTPLGQEKAQKVIQCFDKVDDTIWKDFTEEEMVVLLDSLNRIITNLQSDY